MMPIESDRRRWPVRDSADVHGALRIRERNLPALDHRHALAVVHFQLQRALPQAQENDEHPGKHADDEDHRKEFFTCISAPILLTGKIRLAARPDCFRRNKIHDRPL